MTHRLPLLLDVDGVINCLGVRPGDALNRGLEPHDVEADDGRTYRLHIDPRCREWLALLGEMFDIVWATSWREANQVISPLLGLPGDLRQVPLPLGVWRKTRFIREWTEVNGVERFAWIDDEINPVEDSADLPGALCIPVEPSVGLTDTVVDTLLAWAAERLAQWAPPPTELEE